MGGIALPDVDAAQATVTKAPLSVDTCFAPVLEMTLPGVWKVVTPV